ncbi:reverse transcriptase domain-containing protein [Tanacetum coccineum]
MIMLTNLTIQRQSPSGSGSLPSNTIANPRGDLKAITTRSGVSYDGPTIPPTSSPLPKVVERDLEATKDKMLSLPELTPTRMTLELANRSVAYPVGVAEDVIVKVGKFHFPADFVVVDYDVDPRVPLILGRPFLRMARALIDVHREELILRDGDEQLIFHADSTSKHPNKHGNESINMINFIDITCKDRFPKVLKLKKSNHPSSGNPTPSFVVNFPSPSLISYEDSDSLVEETNTLLSHFNDSSPDYETFCFDIEENSSGSATIHSDDSLPDYDAFYFDDDHIEEKSSGSTTTHSDHSLLDYEAFRFDVDHIEEKSSGSTASYSDHSLLDYEAFSFDVDHIEEKSSGSTTSHSDLSLIEYESFHFDLLVDSFPPIDRSDSHLEEFADELAHIISPPEYDHFYFDIEPDLGELTRRLEEIISEDSTKELTSSLLSCFKNDVWKKPRCVPYFHRM